LLSAASLTIFEHGYEDATIARIIGRADVSRATFYEHFASKEACFLITLEHIEHELLRAVNSNIEAEPHQDVLTLAISALASFAQARPMDASSLMNAAMAAGPRALDARDRVVGAIAQLVTSAQERIGLHNRASALPTAVIVGTACRLLGSRLRRGEPGQEAMQRGLLDLIAAYESPAENARWCSPAAMRAPAHSPLSARAPLRTPPAMAPGRPTSSASAVAENHRLRIIFATAEIIRRDGYPATSVAEITRAARVDSRAFYRLFAGKHDAFRELREFTFQHAMAATAGAFFGVEDWPRRIWEAARAFTHFLEKNPTLTEACLNESDAGGPETVQRFEDLVAGCTIFLQEGYQYQSRCTRSQPSPVALDAIAQAELEIIYRQARDRPGSDSAKLASHIAYVCLAPFVGAARASELIDELRGG
jgi:AcrR family transcriptional regulator